MTFGLMLIFGAGLLTWYYTNAFSRQARERQAAKTAVSNRAQGEMPLPALEPIGLASTGSAETDNRLSVGDHPSRPSSELPGQPTQLPLTQSMASYAPGVPYAGMNAPYGVFPQKTAAQLAKERLLSGTAFAHFSDPAATSSDSAGSAWATGAGPASGSSAGLASVPNAAPAFPDASQGNATQATGFPQPVNFTGNPAVFAAAAANTAGRSDGGIGTLLRPTAIASATAQILPTQRFLLPKGAFIDCTLETAIDSTLPGMTTCITATDTFGLDGKVVLLERGTKLIGETRGQVQQGSARVFVLWTEARTPLGIVVPLDSPGADELGRSGLAGQVDNHFWARFGAAILISTLDGAVQAAVQSSSRGGGTVVYNPSSSESVVTDVLKSTVEIPPTVTKRNGDRIQVFVARDVDFRSVYELRATEALH